MDSGTASRAFAPEASPLVREASDVEVVVVLVTWNSAHLLEEFASTLFPGMSGIARWELVVADNASADETEERVRSLLPSARFVQVGWNSGYAAGINAALAAAPPFKDALILNPDARLTPGSVAAMLRRMSEPSVGIVVPRLRRGDGATSLSLRREPTALRAWGDAVLGATMAGRVRSLGETVSNPATYASPTTAAWAAGAAMLISRSCLAAVGPWDERFFLYSEETDFCLRAWDAGYELWYEPAAEVVHLERGSGTSPWLQSLQAVNRVRLHKKRLGAPRARLFWAGVLAREALRAPRREGSRVAAAALLRPSRVLAQLPRPRRQVASNGNRQE